MRRVKIPAICVWLFSILPANAQPQVEPVTDIRTAAAAARADMVAISDPLTRLNTRYLMLFQEAIENREDYIRNINFAVNSLSRRKKIKLVRYVQGARGALVALDIRDYGWEPQVWENLVCLSPYMFTQLVASTAAPEIKPQKTVKNWPGGIWPVDRKYYPPNAFTYTDDNEVLPEVKAAPVVDTKDKGIQAVTALIENQVAIDLATMSGSKMPIMFAQEFIVNTMDATKGSHYYDFLGIGKTEKDFQKIIAGDPSLAEKFEVDRQGTVIMSGVTLHNRRLTRVPTILGYYWYSTDSKEDIGKKNYLQVLLDRGLENFDASEQIASLPNGLQVYFLADSKGNRQDSAPDFIAGDKMTTNNDHRVRNGISCIRCHSEGILSFKSVFENLRKSVKKESYDYDKLYRLDQLYSGNLNEEFTGDQGLYAKAVAQATGRTTQINASKFSLAFAQWDEKYVTLEVAAKDLGVPPEHHQWLKEALRGLSQSDILKGKVEGEYRDQTILALVADEPEPISRNQWGEAFQIAAALVEQYRVKHPPKPLKAIEEKVKIVPRNIVEEPERAAPKPAGPVIVPGVYKP